jgi:hypothetical protein
MIIEPGNTKKTNMYIRPGTVKSSFLWTSETHSTYEIANLEKNDTPYDDKYLDIYIRLDSQ